MTFAAFISETVYPRSMGFAMGVAVAVAVGVALAVAVAVAVGTGSPAAAYISGSSSIRNMKSSTPPAGTPPAPLQDHPC